MSRKRKVLGNGITEVPLTLSPCDYAQDRLSHKERGNLLFTGLRQAPSGFTVVEAMVAIGIAGLLYAALYGFYSIHLRVVKAEEVRISLQESNRVAVDFLMRELHLAGARPLRDSACEGFERLTAAEEQQVTLQYDSRGNSAGTPPDGCPDDPGEQVTYVYDDSDQVLKRATGGGAPQPLITDVPVNGFLLRYFARDGSELESPLNNPERAEVHTIVVTVRVSAQHPDPQIETPITSELSSTVFLPNPAR
jgi:type II secretory pathway component PulJ